MNREQVLTEAAEIRRVRLETREALRTRAMTAAEMFAAADDDPRLALNKVFSILWVIPGVGKIKTLRRLEELGLAEDVTIAELDAGARTSLVELAAGRLIVVSGPSGVGKGTVIRTLALHLNFHLSVSATTRDMRPGEEHGREYFFLSRPEFETWIDEGRMLEWAEYSGNLYGTPRGAVEEKLAEGRDVVLEIEVQGAAQVKEAMPESKLVFILPPSLEELEDRLRGRGDTTDIADRLKTANEELAQVDSFDHTVVNEDVDRAAEQLASILRVLPRFRIG